MIWLWLLGCPFVTDAQLSALQDADGDGVLSQRFGGEDCDDEDPSVGAPSRWAPDDDGDGFGALGEGISSCESQPGLVDNEGDCDDTDPNVGLSRSLFADQDGDGFGDPAAPHPGCALEPGFVADDTDCDDQDEDSHPGAVWHQDSDGDTFGDPDISEVSCLSPPGSFVPADPAGFDCDDTDASVYPGQPLSVEQPADGVDTNCDGRTELDFDGDGLADIRGCEGLTPTVVSVQPGQTALQDAIDAIDPGDDCVILELQDGTYGGALLGGPPHLAIVAAPLSKPSLVATPGQPIGIDIPVSQPQRALTLEGLALQGFSTAVRFGADGDLLASGLAFERGDGIVTGEGGLGREVPSGTLEIYDTDITDGAEAIGGGWAIVRGARLRIDGALSAVSDSIVLGGSEETTLSDSEFVRSTAVIAILGTDGDSVYLDGLTFEGNTTTPVRIAADHVEISNTTIRDSYTSSVTLLAIVGATGSTQSPTTRIEGLLVEDNTWAISDLESACPLFTLLATIHIWEHTLEISDSVIRNNARFCGGPVLSSDEPAVISGLELSSGPYNPDMFGLFMTGSLSDSTIAGFDRGVVVGGFLLGEIDIARVIFAGTGAGVDIVDAPAISEAFIDDSTFWLASTDESHLGLGNTSEDPLFLRYHPSLPPSLWDLSLHPGSASSGRGAYPSGSDATLDEDADGLYDLWEERWCGGTTCLPGEDPDGDTLDNEAELAMGTLPLGADTDSDNTTDPDDDDPLDPTR